jgi:hypothetical protein
MENVLHIFTTGIPAIQQSSLPGFGNTFQNVGAHVLNDSYHLRNEVLWHHVLLFH